ncbi:glycosyltransferase 87 family protein [Streptomyces sp. NPDC050504]|uniref:glycosyltransferase 87 family protein n=1 Tax=Streptomyces sp. NPDC050504 TaxID=3365618 RepID=UPI00379EFF64
MTTQPAAVATYVRVRHLPLALAWLTTRALMLHLLVADDLGVGGVTGEVYVLYRRWYEQLATGAFPEGDPTWQYPPGAGLVILSPGALPGTTFFQGFVALTVLCDLAVTVALARAGSTGAWYWTAGLPLLLHVPFGRYDVQVTAFAVLGLLAVRTRPRVGGALAGLGALVKVWPALTLIGTPRGRTTREAWTSAAVACAVLLGVVAAAFSGSLDFLRQQSDRGVQIESVGGTALSLAQRVHGGWQVEYRYGSMEVTGPYVSSVALLALVLTLAAFLWLLVWRVRAHRWSAATPFDAALCAVLLFTVTSRVISPQYLVWLLGLAAVCLTSRHTTQRLPALLLLPAAALSALAFPLLYGEVTSGTTVGCTVMVLRNGLLLTAAALSCRSLWRATAAKPRVPARGA